MSGWPSVHTEYWLRALKRRAHEVHFLFPYDQPSGFDGLPNGIISHRFSGWCRLRGIGPWAGGVELRRRLRELAPDVLHVHSIFAVEKWRQFPWIIAMGSFHPLIVTAWGSDLLRVPHLSRSARFLVGFVLRSADLITADAESLLEAAHRMGVSKDRLHRIQFGVDVQLFHPEVETAALRERLGLGVGPVVFSPRAFKPLYNQLKIVEAIPGVLNVYPTCRFIFKCRLDHHSAEYEAQVRQRILELGVRDAVRILSTIPYEELPALYALSDIAVSVPESDGTPRSILEAMACGVFPIVSDLPALREWIEEGENGLFIQPIESQRIGEAILRALSSPETLHRAKGMNQSTIRKRASSEFWVDRMEDLYRKVAS